MAGRPLEGVYRDGLSPGGWVEECRKLASGLYCQHCLGTGDTTALPDYDDQDLKDAGLLDTPHIGQSADDFNLDTAWKKVSVVTIEHRTSAAFSAFWICPTISACCGLPKASVGITSVS